MCTHSARFAIACGYFPSTASLSSGGGQEDREYLAAGQESDSRSHQRKQVQQRFHSHNGKDAIRAAPWRERRMVDVQTSHLGIGSRRGVDIWSSDQVADWLLTVSPDPLYIQYAETFKRHRIRGANLSRLDFRLLTCMGVTSVGHQIDILQAIDRLLQSSSTDTTRNSRPSGNFSGFSRPPGHVSLTGDQTFLNYGDSTETCDRYPQNVSQHRERQAFVSVRGRPIPQPAVKDKRYAESLPGEWNRGYHLTPNPYHFDREPFRSAEVSRGARSIGSPDSPWFYSSDDDRTCSQYYSRAGSELTSPSSSYSDVRTSGRMRVTSPLANDQWETDGKWYEDKQCRSPRRHNGSKVKDRGSEEVRLKRIDGQTNSCYSQDNRFSRNRAKPFREQSNNQSHQVFRSHPGYEQTVDVDSHFGAVINEDQREKTRNTYYRDVAETREANSLKQQHPEYREVSVDDAIGSIDYNKHMKSRPGSQRGTPQSMRSINPFDRFSSLRAGGVRTSKDKSLRQVVSRSLTNGSKLYADVEEDKCKVTENEFEAEWAVASNEAAVDLELVPMPTLSSRSNVTTDSGLPPSLRQSPVRTQPDSQDKANVYLAGHQQHVRRSVEKPVRQRRMSEGQEEHTRITQAQNQEVKSRNLEIPIEGNSQPSSPMEDTNESHTRHVKSASRLLQAEYNKGLMKHSHVKFTLNTSSIDTKEFVVHRLAAILQVNKDRLMSNVTSTESPSGKCVTLALEMSAVRQLRQILESDKDQLAPLNAISVQIGSDQEMTLQKPRSLMKALENSNLRIQNCHFLKIVVVGDAACGKTSFIRAYVNDKRCTGEYNPTVSDTFDCCISIGKEPVMLQIHDTAALEGYEKLRPDAYRGSDLIVICFCIARQSSLHNVEDYWCPEIRLHNPTAPIVVAGLQKDLRDDYEMSSQVYRTKYQPPVKAETAKRIAGSVHALCYRECSSVTMQGVKELFDLIVYTAYEHKKRQFRKTDSRAKCSVL
ncbi:uncharacterized protein LOC134179971 isoform X2 [Corticium candelabrum]|uniref:uncharacterized protein LOC134179971 isoform X2 n=1 Tax=Corticium candelabrum TaxID=121492 RepID=UPI002E26A023|nr:uncharacterized protein LOC134179971 isoform X2 [Corticium candelabrum]